MCLFFAGESGGESSQSLVNGGKMIRTENISESEEQRMNKKIFKRAVAMMMAAVLTVGAALPSSNVFASGSDEEKDTKTLAVYDADVRTDLDEDEVVTAGDIVIAAGYGFDIENDMEGIVYEQEKVAVSYYPDQGSFDADKPGDYDTYYKVEPVSGKDAYLVHRIITVEEIQEKQTDNTEAAPAEDTTETADDEEPAPGSEDTEYIDLDTQIVKGLSIQRAPAAMLKAAPASGTKDGKDSMKVGFSGYAKFCGRSMGVKYISESGDYYHHSVYCLDLNKKTTNGIADKLTGVYKPHEYGDVILPLTVIRRFDCILHDKKDEVRKKYEEVKNLPMKDVLLRKTSGYDFYNTSKYTFEKLMDDPDNIEDNFHDYLNGFSENVRDILEKFKFDGHITTMANKGILSARIF